MGVKSGGSGGPIHIDYLLEGFDGEYHNSPSHHLTKIDVVNRYQHPAPELKGFNVLAEDSAIAVTPVTKNALLAKNNDRPEDEKSNYQFVDRFAGQNVTQNHYISYTYNRNSYRLQLNPNPLSDNEDT